MNKNVSILWTIAILLLISSCATNPQASLVPSPTGSPPTLTPPTVDEATKTIPTSVSGEIAVIYDDDGSPDGTTALLYLLSDPKVNLKAINISYGEAYPDIYIQYIGRKLEYYGITGIPLGYGQSAPLAGTKAFPEGMRQAANNFWGWTIPYPERTYPSQPAAELIVETINQSPTPVTVFISGPCTNLAQALRLDPGITNNISSIFIMGGSVYVPGNISDLISNDNNKVAEWNIYADAQAAKEVFESGLTIYLVPLDATNQVLVTREDVSHWRQGGEIANFAAEIYENLLSNWNVEQGAIWDLMTAIIMTNPELCQFEPLHLEVISEEGDKTGQTAVVPGQEANVLACLQPDADGIRAKIAEIFSDQTDNQISVPKPTAVSVLEPTATPEMLIFYDGFTTSMQSGWEWWDEDPTRWSLTGDGWLQIVGGDKSLLADGNQSNLLCRNSPEGVFQITVHLSVNPVENFQQATLYLYQDGNNYVALNRGFCGPCETGGGGVFMEYKFTDRWGAYQVKSQDTDLYLRLVNQDATIFGYYAFEENDWQLLGKVGNFFDDPKVCLGVTNVDSSGTIDAELEAKFDYVDISFP